MSFGGHRCAVPLRPLSPRVGGGCHIRSQVLGGNSQGCGPPLKGLWSQLVAARGPCGGLGSDTCAGLVWLPTKGQAGWSAREALIHGAEGRPELGRRGRQAEGGHGKGTHGRMVLESRSAVSGAQRLATAGAQSGVSISTFRGEQGSRKDFFWRVTRLVIGRLLQWGRALTMGVVGCPGRSLKT